MNRASSLIGAKLATPTLELFKGIKHGCTIGGTSVLQVPATNLNFRKGIIIQNKHATNRVYLGGGIPYLIEGARGEIYTDADHDKRGLQWWLSAGGGTNEYFLATSASAPGDPSLTTITYLYYRTWGSATEVLADAAESPGSLSAQHKWGWGDAGSENSFNTLYIRTDGSAPANNPSKKYEHILGYYFVLSADDTTLTGGVELLPTDSIHITADGTVKVFSICSAATTAIGHIEVT